MRRFLSLVLALVAGLFVLNVPAAVGGGPTSVLLLNYETGQSAAALNGSTSYADLQAILGDENTPATTVKRPAGITESDNATVRMVWLIHDVSAWRIDNVYVEGRDIWVETYSDSSGTDPYAAKPVWHQPARGADLATVLTTLGVVGTGTSASGTASGIAAVANDAAADPAVVQASTSGAPWWLAATLGVLGLALGGAFGARVTPRLRHQPQVAAMG